MNQTTLSQEFELNGVGIHSGKSATMVFKPALPDTGIRFVRTDLDGLVIPAVYSSLSQESSRATILHHGQATLMTPEHVLAACYGAGLSNCEIHIDSEEVPIFDGSSLEILRAIRSVDLVDQPIQSPYLELATSLRVQEGDAWIDLSPSDHLEIIYTLSYPDSFIGTQTFRYVESGTDFDQEIAPARTYGFIQEVETLLKNNLARGGTLENAVVIYEDRYSVPLRFTDELARHKVLDVIGDFALLGCRLKMKIHAHKSGHALNQRAVTKLSHHLVR